MGSISKILRQEIEKGCQAEGVLQLKSCVETISQKVEAQVDAVCTVSAPKDKVTIDDCTKILLSKLWGSPSEFNRGLKRKMPAFERTVSGPNPLRASNQTTHQGLQAFTQVETRIYRAQEPMTPPPPAETNGEVTEVADATFEKEVLQSSIPVLVMFKTNWCGPCRESLPGFKKLAKRYEGHVKFVQLDRDKNRTSKRAYRVTSIPTFILFQKGQEKNRFVGGSRGIEYLLEPMLKPFLPVTQTASSTQCMSDLEMAIFHKLNEDRTRNATRISPLEADCDLAHAARAHSIDMGTRYYMNHESPEGKKASDRIWAVAGRFGCVGENIWWSKANYAFDIASAAQASLMKSPGHRKNILRPEVAHVGIGVYQDPSKGIFVTQNFGGCLQIK